MYFSLLLLLYYKFYLFWFYISTLGLMHFMITIILFVLLFIIGAFYNNLLDQYTLHFLSIQKTIIFIWWKLSHVLCDGCSVTSLHTVKKAAVNISLFTEAEKKCFLQLPSNHWVEICHLSSLSVYRAISLREYIFPRQKKKLQLAVLNLRKLKTHWFSFMEYVLVWDIVYESGVLNMASPDTGISPYYM